MNGHRGEVAGGVEGAYGSCGELVEILVDEVTCWSPSTPIDCIIVAGEVSTLVSYKLTSR